jgi:hypothetical protein
MKKALNYGKLVWDSEHQSSLQNLYQAESCLFSHNKEWYMSRQLEINLKIIQTFKVDYTSNWNK